MTKTHITRKKSETVRLGSGLAKEILEKGPQKNQAIIIGLKGDLGSGKTTFLQGFAKGLGIKKKILSPTFLIMKKFPLMKSDFLSFYHLDCYRVQKEKDVLDLGFKEILSNPQNIVAIEWSDKIKEILPKNKLNLFFEFLDKNKRRIVLKCK